ncbi:MAG: hypothetical protein GZ085_14300 [Sulfuriferula multivorans]|uniref:Uncharacterized protein n=1 Tax=Sulfuriferula multivorans TaxID=1559896 RepID=A0A7C9TDT9_9PROT|nr:hypothetical protein [Sulfuriferula multivorans]
MSYELGVIKRTRPDQIRGNFFRSEVEDVQCHARWELQNRIKNRMQTGISVEAATAVVTAIQEEFEAMREDLMASHAKLIEHAVTCIVAADVKLTTAPILIDPSKTFVTLCQKRLARWQGGAVISGSLGQIGVGTYRNALIA